jgi:hypothetical protein
LSSFKDDLPPQICDKIIGEWSIADFRGIIGTFFSWPFFSIGSSLWPGPFNKTSRRTLTLRTGVKKIQKEGIAILANRQQQSVILFSELPISNVSPTDTMPHGDCSELVVML